MKKTVYVVMVNDSVDSVWTDQTEACLRGDELHKPNWEPETGSPCMFARVEPFKLNKKGKYEKTKTTNN